MTDDAGPPIDEALVGRVDEKRRRLLKIILGSTAAYSVPLMASFSMEGLKLGSAAAGEVPVPPFVANQIFGEPGPPGPPFGANQTEFP